MRCRIAVSSLMALLLCALPAAAATTYNLAWLDVPTSTGLFQSRAFGLNNLGQVVGEGYVNGYYQGFIWQNGSVTGLGWLATASGSVGSNAYGINDAGVVVGQSSSSTGLQAFKWQSGVGMTGLGYLDAPAAGRSSAAFDINDLNLTVGDSLTSAGQRAFKHDTQMTALSPAYGAARAVTNAGDVVGFGNLNGSTQAFAADSAGAITWLGFISGTTGFSQAYGANEPDATHPLQVVGTSTSTNGRQAFSWTAAGGMAGLGIFPGDIESWANDVNNQGVVVGASSYHPANSPRAVVWAGGSMHELATLVNNPEAGLFLSEARAINESGQIAGWGLHNGYVEAFLLTPVSPTPEIQDIPQKLTVEFM